MERKVARFLLFPRMLAPDLVARSRNHHLRRCRRFAEVFQQQRQLLVGRAERRGRSRLSAQKLIPPCPSARTRAEIVMRERGPGED